MRAAGSEPAAANSRGMHNRALHDTLAEFVEQAAWQLAEEVSGGAEVPFELVSNPPTPSGAAPLYCYRPLTQRFLAERAGALGRLPAHPAAVHGLTALPDLTAYLRSRGRRAPGADPRVHADAALQAFLTAIWGEASDFTFDAERFAAAYDELEEAVYAGCSLALVVTPVEGLRIEAEEVALGAGLRLVRGVALPDPPPGLRGEEYATVAVLALEGEPGPGPSLELAGRRLRRLQTALRLWDDAEPALGPTAWARTDGAPWLAVPLGGGRRAGAGDCLVTGADEDPLRAFCALVTSRTPRAGELAWALRRFELGCERGSALDALTDWLLAARALLAEPDGPGYAGLSERLAAICAPPEERVAMIARLRQTIALERGVVAGLVRPEPAVEALAAELGGCLRAVLRDVLCGHLEPDLRRLADELLATVARV